MGKDFMMAQAIVAVFAMRTPMGILRWFECGRDIKAKPGRVMDRNYRGDVFLPLWTAHNIFGIGIGRLLRLGQSRKIPYSPTMEWLFVHRSFDHQNALRPTIRDMPDQRWELSQGVWRNYFRLLDKSQVNTENSNEYICL